MTSQPVTRCVFGMWPKGAPEALPLGTLLGCVPCHRRESATNGGSTNGNA